MQNIFLLKKKIILFVSYLTLLKNQMPILKTEFLPEKCCEIAIWDITENFDELRILCAELGDTNKISDNFKAQARKKQFLASRMALNILIKEAKIIYNLNGTPTLVDDNRFVSISHSNNRAAIIVGNKKVGIDIEKVSDKIEKIAPKFMNASELLFAKSVITKTICWCAKEALFKMDGTGNVIFAEDIIVDSFEVMPKGTITASFKNNCYHLHYELIDEFILVYVTN